MFSLRQIAFRTGLTRLFRNCCKPKIKKVEKQHLEKDCKQTVTSIIVTQWNAAFTKHLLFTNTSTSGVLMVLGDIMAQEIEYQRGTVEKRYDWKRVGRMFITGLLLGPLHHYFYNWMNNMLPDRSLKSVTKKILLDQFLMSPACILTLFYAMDIMERRNINEINQEVSKKFVRVYVVDWTVWPPTQYINFCYVPVKYQVVYINIVTMFYNVFLSYMKHLIEDYDY